jgi:hypothetical protein
MSKEPIETCENVLEYVSNRGGFKLSIVAQFSENRSVLYIIRLENPEGETIDFISSLEGFKKIGELLLDLYSFAEKRLFAKDPEQLKELLTAESIRTYVKFKKVANFKK